MAYRVKVHRKAYADAEEAHAFIFKDSPERASRWYERLLEAIGGLSQFPMRCKIAPESRGFPIDVRELLYGKRSGIYRILFRIDEQQKTVVVLRIRHSARARLEPDELFDDE